MTAPQKPPSLWARLVATSTQIHAGEGPVVAASFALYFCVMAGYFAVRPVRETIGTLLGDERVRDLFVWSWVVAIGVVPVYGALCARFARRTFLPWIYGFVACALGACGIAISTPGQVPTLAGEFFYVMISVLNLFVVSVMWSFLLELYDTAQTRRLFGFIAAGGTAGALAGPFMTSQLVGRIGNHGVLYLGASLFLLAIVCQRTLLSRSARASEPGGGASDDTRDAAIGGNPFAGFTLVLRSPYLLGIALFVVLLAAVNTFLYFEQLKLVRATFADAATRTRVFSTLDVTVQALTITLQLFATGRLASRWGVGWLLVVVPLAMVAGLTVLAVINTFAVLAVVIVLRRVGEYAFVRPGREMLYSHVDTETKYKAKNLIDVPVYRGADALVAQATQGFEAAGVSAALVGAAVAGAWAVNGWWLGRRPEHLAKARTRR